MDRIHFFFGIFEGYRRSYFTVLWTDLPRCCRFGDLGLTAMFNLYFSDRGEFSGDFWFVGTVGVMIWTSAVVLQCEQRLLEAYVV